MKRIIMLMLVAVLCLSAAACGGSNADTVSTNISKEAEKFRVQRHIVGINGITDKPLFEVEGRCSIETETRLLVVTCKHGPKDYRKHYIGLSDNTTFVNVQTKGVAVSEYRTKIIIRPQALVPDLDLVTGNQSK